MTHAILTVDLGFGDAGKGSVVDYLTRAEAAHTVVRFNGGAQAAHRVVTPDGREHVFSQFGSGCFAGAATHLSRFMLIDPPAMLTEAAHLAALGCPDVLARTTLDADALVLTPYGRAINRLRELARGDQRHGSCGLGIGETVSDQLQYGTRVLRAGDLADPTAVATKLQFTRALALTKLEALRPCLPATEAVAQELAPLYDRDLPNWLAETYARLAAQLQIVGPDHLRHLLARPGSVIFEAAQGVLLDEWYGLHPYTTWSTTTLANAEQLLAEANFAGAITRLGITRAYTTRHGAGPLPSEDAALSRALPDARNLAHPWQQHFRVGWLDLVLLRYALKVVGPLDGLALTCLDRLAELPAAQVCHAYQTDPSHLVPVSLEGTALAKLGGSTLLPTIASQNPNAKIQNRFSHLPVASAPDLSHQQALTDLLQRCQPLLTPISVAALPAYLEQQLGLPVLLRSYGPSATAKQGWVAPTGITPQPAPPSLATA